MNLSGILVVAAPAHLPAVIDGLRGLEGVEVHQRDEATGRIIVVQEAADIHAEIDAIKAIKALPHVVMAEMVYHYFADDEMVYAGLPRELAEAQGPCCAVPTYLHDCP